MNDLRVTIKIPSLVSSTTPFFTWYKSIEHDSDQVSYDLAITPSGDWYSQSLLLITDIQASGSFCRYDLTTPISPNTVYEWRVRAYDGVEYSEWSAPLSFLYSLADNTNYIVAYWRCEETSGTRYDSVNNYDLISFGTDPGSSITGKIGNALWVPEDQQSGYYADSIPVASGSIVLSAWVYIGGYTVETIDGYLYYDGTPCFYTHDDGVGTNYCVFSLFSSPNLYTTNVPTGWHHVVMMRTLTVLEAWIDGQYVGQEENTINTLPGGQFLINHRNQYASYIHAVDEVGIWHGMLMPNLQSKQAWVDAMYNDGSGVSFNTIMATRDLFHGYYFESTENQSTYLTSSLTSSITIYSDSLSDLSSKISVACLDSAELHSSIGVVITDNSDLQSTIGVTQITNGGTSIYGSISVYAYSQHDLLAELTTIQNTFDSLSAYTTVISQNSAELASSVLITAYTASQLDACLNIHRQDLSTLSSSVEIIKNAYESIAATLSITDSGSSSLYASLGVMEDTYSDMLSTVLVERKQEDVIAGKITIELVGGSLLNARLDVVGYNDLGAMVDVSHQLRAKVCIETIEDLSAIVSTFSGDMIAIDGLITITQNGSVTIPAKLVVERIGVHDLSVRAFVTERIERFTRGLPLGVFGTIYPDKIITIKPSDPKVAYTHDMSSGMSKIGTIIPDEERFKLSPHASEAGK